MNSHTAEQLIEAGDYGKAAELLKSSSEQSAKALFALARLESGATDEAHDIAAQLLKRTLPPSIQARCLSVMGRALARKGRVTEGLAHLKRAVSLAASVDTYLEADIRSQYATAALTWLGVEPALPELPALRRASLESANRSALTEYHIVYARIAALRGWWKTMQSEIAAAGNLLSSFEHLATSWRLHQSIASITILAGHLDQANAHGREALRLAGETGSTSKHASTLANNAYIAAAGGEFARARHLLDDSNRLIEKNSQIRFALLATGISIGIRSGDARFAAAMLEEGVVLSNLLPEETYYRLCFGWQQIAWHISRGSFTDALALAETIAPSVSRLADLDLADRIKLLRTEALHLDGRQSEALALLGTLACEGRQLTIEVVAELERVVAVLCRDEDQRHKSFGLLLARRVLETAGLRGALCDVHQTAERFGISLAGRSPKTSALDPASVVKHVALILRLGRHPRVLARELFELLRATRLCISAALEEKDQNGVKVVLETEGNGGLPGSRRTPPIELELPGSNGLAYIISAQPLDAAAFTMLSLALRQIATASVACSDVATAIEPPTPWPFESADQRDGMIVAAESTTELLGTTKRIAPSRIPVLITGETGTGKELVARALHDASPRSDKPWIPFNCSAVSKDMLDAQLFGYRKGAFTGAAEAFQGVIRAAAGGTLFLDEIGEVALDVQPKLLRFLESGEIHPLGEPRPITVDVRVVAATNANLEQLVEEGRFREDLFYRLNVVRLQVPALRERREEIPPLVQHYVDRASREAHKSGIRVADETMEYLILYRWPGNVRQLANEIRRMVALAESNAVLMPEHLSHDIAASRRTIPASERPPAPKEFVVRMDQPMTAAMEHLERSMIQYAMTLSGGRVEDAATRLGLSRKGLYLKRQRLAMQDAEADSTAVTA